MENLRVSLIGPGDIEFHYQEILGISKERFQSELEKIARALAESGVEIELLPAKGVCFELAKFYKANKGKRVVASVPKSDAAYGIKHLEPYLNEKIKGKRLFDEEIDTGDWRQQNRLKALLGDAVLYLGISFASELEMNYGLYLVRLMKGLKEGVTSAQYLHPEVRAGKIIPYTLFVYSPFIKSYKLDAETEAYMKKYGINLEYVENPEELKQKLAGLKK